MAGINSYYVGRNSPALRNRRNSLSKFHLISCNLPSTSQIFQMTLGRQKLRSHLLMVWAGMVLGKIVAKVPWSGPPIISKLLLSSAAAKPMKTHVHCFGAPGLHSVADHGMSSCVVSLYGGPRLFVAHLAQCFSDGDSFTGVNKHCPDFCLGGG